VGPVYGRTWSERLEAGAGELDPDDDHVLGVTFVV
jgi:hypothetical protein